MESKAIKLDYKNIKFLDSFRVHPRETWNDLFNKLKTELKGGKKK